MTQQSNLPANRRPATEIDVLKNHLTKRADDFKQVLPSHITPEKFQRVVATAALQNPQLMACDRQSLLLSAMKLAQDGLVPDGREAALVPFKSRVKGDDGQFYDKWLVQAMPMVYGLRKKILQSGEVLSIETGVVYLADYESGRFLYEVGLEPPIRYRPDLLLPIEETADEKIVAAYSLAKIKNDTGGEPYFSVEVMRRAEIDKVRQTSQTGAVGRTYAFGKNKGKVIEPKGPWVDWFGEMARKTVLRRHAKVLPMNSDVLQTFERDIEAEREADRTAAESAAGFLGADTGNLVLPGNSSTEGLFERLRADFENAKDIAAIGAVRDEWFGYVDAGDLERGENEDLENAFNIACERIGVDPKTGEVIKRDNRGMTEVSEEEARALDAAQSQGNDPAAEGSDDDGPAWKGPLDGLRMKLAQAKTVKAVEGIERDWLNLVRAAVDDEAVVQEFEKAISTMKSNLAPPKEG